MLPMMTQAPSAHQQEGESHVPFVGNANLAHRGRFFFFLLQTGYLTGHGKRGTASLDYRFPLTYWKC